MISFMSLSPPVFFFAFMSHATWDLDERKRWPERPTLAQWTSMRNWNIQNRASHLYPPAPCLPPPPPPSPIFKKDPSRKKGKKIREKKPSEEKWPFICKANISSPWISCKFRRCWWFFFLICLGRRKEEEKKRKQKRRGSVKQERKKNRKRNNKQTKKKRKREKDNNRCTSENRTSR